MLSHPKCQAADPCRANIGLQGSPGHACKVGDFLAALADGGYRISRGENIICDSEESGPMIDKSRVAVYTVAILFSLTYIGCKEQSSAPPASGSPSAASAPPVTTGTTATSATDANTSAKSTTAACQLLTAEEIKSVQGDALKETKASEQASGPYATSQCFFATNDFVNSVSLTLTQKNPATSGGQGIKDFWRERFGHEDRREKDREKRRDKDAARGEEGEEEGLPAQRVKSLGDEAYWVGNSKIGALYVLKGDKLLRISIGGALTQGNRTEKMKALAQSALKRL